MSPPEPITKNSWAAMTAAVGVSADAADGQPARLSVSTGTEAWQNWLGGLAAGAFSAPRAPTCAGSCRP
jgi:hypothetical protein